jgi:superfamily II DNA/RNA helicase
VLDEADRLLDDSFGSEMECILGAVSEKRQTLLFSATMTQNLRTLRDLSMEDAFCFDAGGARYVSRLHVRVLCQLLGVVGVARGLA